MTEEDRTHYYGDGHDHGEPPALSPTSGMEAAYQGVEPDREHDGDTVAFGLALADLSLIPPNVPPPFVAPTLPERREDVVERVTYVDRLIPTGDNVDAHGVPHFARAMSFVDTGHDYPDKLVGEPSCGGCGEAWPCATWKAWEDDRARPAPEPGQ